MRYSVARSRSIQASAARIYAVFADYRIEHPRILARAFTNLTVERGGWGDGTVITFDATVLGRTERLRGVVTEPEPGRVLVESYPDSGMVTTFTVEPTGATEARVTIGSELAQQMPLLGPVERWLVRRTLGRIFDEELGHVATHVATHPTPLT